MCHCCRPRVADHGSPLRARPHHRRPRIEKLPGVYSPTREGGRPARVRALDAGPLALGGYTRCQVHHTGRRCVYKLFV